MKILVTGSRGFLGTELVKKLKKSGDEVIDCDILLGHDITKLKSIESIFKKNKNINSCVHLAAVSNLDIYDEDEKLGEDINVLGTSYLMRLCDKYNTKLFVASTCCLYGDNMLKVSNEESQISPTEAYASSKMKCEELVGLHNGKSENKFINMRLATFYGGRYARGALCISKFIEKMLNGDSLEIHGDGSMARTYTHVLDMVSGIETLVRAGFDGKLEYDTYNVTCSDSYSVWDIVKEIAKHLDNDANIIIKLVKNRPRPFTQYVIESTRLKDLGWEPSFTWETGIKEAISAYKKNGMKWIK